MRLEFEPNASALPVVENEVAVGNQPSELDRILREGVKAAQEGNRAEARTLLLRVTDADADNENAWLWLASISEYPEELLVFLNNVLRVNPENERALEWHRATKSLLAKTLVQRGIDAMNDQRPDFARQCFEQAIDQEAENEMAWLWLASVAEDEDERVTLFEKVLEINPDNETARASIESAAARKNHALFQEALSAAFDGNHIFALEALDVVLQRDSTYEDAWTLKAHIATSFEERAESCLQLRQLNPDNEMANANLASWRVLSEKLERDRDVVETAPEAEAAYEDVSDAVEEFAPAEEVYEESADEVAAETEEAPAMDLADVDAQRDDVEELSADASDRVEYAAPDAETVEFRNEYAENEVGEQPDAFEDEDPSAEFSEAESVQEFAEAEEEVHSETAESVGADETQRFQAEDDRFAADYAHPDVPTGELDPAVEESAHDQMEAAAEVDMSAPEMPTALAEVAEAQSEEAEMHLAFIDSEDDDEAVDFFRNLTEVPNPNRVEVVEENLLEEPVAEAAPADEDWRNTSPQVFVNYEAQTPENSFEGRVEQVIEPIRDEAAAAPQVDVFDRVEVAPEPTPVLSKSDLSLCPFCSAENDRQMLVCESCHSVLSLTDMEMILNQQNANKELLRVAVESMERENESFGISAEKMASLGVGHINLKNYRQGYYFLQEAVRMNPSNVILEAQVNALAIRLAEIEEQFKPVDGMSKIRKILVVDDSATVRKLISGKLEKSGHEVICAVDGVDAMAKINDLVPDLILLDITMPRMDGYQVCKLIRGNDATKDVPVVMISGKDGFFDKVRGKMAGTTGYITKPFGPETLMKTVETYLS